jgi:DNA (cytosine-5)-methyltransferase 1
MHANLIPATRSRLMRAGVHYAIENVENARRHLVSPTCLCGVYFGLKTFRHRYIETSVPLGHTPKGPDGLYLPHIHDFAPLLVTTAGANSRRAGNFKSVKHAPAAYGIDWMIGRELAQAIPPAYSRWIGEQMMPLVMRKKAGAA